MSVRREQLVSHLTDFHEDLFEYFSNICRDNSCIDCLMNWLLIRGSQCWRYCYNKCSDDEHKWCSSANQFGSQFVPINPTTTSTTTTSTTPLPLLLLLLLLPPPSLLLLILPVLYRHYYYYYYYYYHHHHYYC